MNKPNIKFPKIQKPKIKLQNFSIRDLRKSPILSLVKKELKNYFSTPLAYIVIGLFIIIVSILLFAVFKFQQYGSTDLTLLFTSIGFAFIIIVPALTMGSISKERLNGTIEYLLTQPITEAQFIIGKFIANALLLILMLALTLPITIIVSTWQQLDFGQLFMQYTGAFVLGLCFISVGIAVSAFFKNEIASFLTSILISAIFIVIGQVIPVPLAIEFIVDKFSLLAHYQSISRGVADLRDILYFVAFISAFSSLAYYFVIKDKFPKGHQSIKYSRIALVFALIIALGIGSLGQIINLRVDFTREKVYTLSPVSSKLVNNIADTLTMTLYASASLPLAFQAELRDVQDLLRDYSSSSAGKVNIVTKYINADDTTLKSEADSNGLQEMIFAVDTNDSSQQTKGYFGLTFKYADNSDTLNITNEISSDLEYQITKRIKKIANPNPKKIGYVSSGVEYSRQSDLQSFSTELSDLFTVEDLALTKEKPEIASDYSAIIIDNPIETFDTAIQTSLKNYFNNGGSIFFMSNPITISSETQLPVENTGSMSDFFADYGIRIDKSMVYDLRNNNYVNAGYVTRYPLFIIASATGSDVSILKDVKNVSILWGSPISINESKLNGAKLYKLLQTSINANTEDITTLSINIDTEWTTKNNDGVKTVAVALENSKGGRAVIVGDAKFLSDNYGSLVSLNENLAFGLASTEWLAKDDSIAEIKAKTQTATRLILDNEQTTIITVTGTGVPIILIIGFAAVTFYIRKKKQNRIYEYHNED